MRRRVDDELLDQAIREPSAAQEELEGLLRVSRALSEAFAVAPPEDAVARARARAMTAFTAPATPVRRRDPLATPYPWLPQLRVRALATAAIVIGILGALVAGSYGSLPGDALYGVKLGTEEVRLVAAIDAFDRARVHLDIADARLAEVVRAQEVGRAEAMQESLRRYTEAILAVEQEIRSGDLSGDEARQILADAGDTLALQARLLETIRPGAPAPAKPDVDIAIEVLRGIELPPPPQNDRDEPSPGPSITPTEDPSPSPSPTEEPEDAASPEPTQSTAEDPAPQPSEPPAEPGTSAGGASTAEDPSLDP